MQSYAKSEIRTSKISLGCAAGQYVLEFTPEFCPEITNEGNATAEGFLFCSASSEPELGFTALVSCSNIGGTYTVVYGDSIPGGGLDCDQNEQSYILPLISIHPALPENCIVDVLFTDGEDACGDPIPA